MRHAATLLVMLGCVHPQACAESMSEAVGAALTRFPDFRAAQASRRAAAERVEQARAPFFPSADVALGSGRENTDNPGTRAQGQDVYLNRRESEITLSQLVFDSGASWYALRGSEERADGALYQVANTAEAVAQRAALAYLEVLRLRGQVALAAENVAAHERTVRQVETLVERGAGRRSDLQQAAGRLALAQNTLTQVSGQLHQGEAAYRHVVGQSPGALARPDTLRARLPDDIERVIQETLAAHPAVLAAEREHNAAQAERDAARGRLGPRVSVEAGHIRNKDVDGVRGLNEERYLMLRLRSNLFRGFGDLARSREAQARVDESGANLSRARNDVERDLRQAWLGLAASRGRLPELQRHAEISAEVVAAYRAQFGIGQRSLLDVLNSESELYNARSNALNGELAVTSDEVRVLAAVGILVNTLGLGVPEESHAER